MIYAHMRRPRICPAARSKISPADKKEEEEEEVRETTWRAEEYKVTKEMSRRRRRKISSGSIDEEWSEIEGYRIKKEERRKARW